MKELWTGFWAVLRAIPLVVYRPKLRRLAAWPILLTIVITGALSVASLVFGQRGAHNLLSHASAFWQGVGVWGAVALLLALSLVVGFFVSLVIGQPFIDLLSAETEVEFGGRQDDTKLTLRSVAREGWLVAVDVAVDTLWLVAAQIVLLLMHLVPVAGTLLHGAVSSLVNVWFAGSGMVCSSLCRRGDRGRARWKAMQAMPWTVLGVGLGTLLVMVVPLAQLLTLPVAAVGGTLAVIDREKAHAA